MSYRRDGDRVTLEMSVETFEALLMALGTAAGALMREPAMFYSILRLANTINEGNPRFTPYEIPEEKTVVQ